MRKALVALALIGALVSCDHPNQTHCGAQQTASVPQRAPHLSTPSALACG